VHQSELLEPALKLQRAAIVVATLSIP